MLCTIIGMLIKLVGIFIAIPNTWRQYKHWRDKEVAKLWEANSLYLRRGTKLNVRFWKRWAYILVRMPNPHLWAKKYDKSKDSSGQASPVKRSLFKRLLRRE